MDRKYIKAMNYADGDMVNCLGQRWVIERDKDDPDVWWASNSDGEEIEFFPGTEDWHDKLGDRPKTALADAIEEANDNESHIKQKLGLY